MRFIGYISLTVSFIFIAISFHHTPVNINETKAQWILFAILSALISNATQSVQTLLFIRNEGLLLSWLWALWLNSEKAWVNIIWPGKAGTAGSIALLHRKHKIRWDKYIRFMVLCGAITASLSLAAAVAIISHLHYKWFIAVIFVLLGFFISKITYPQTNLKLIFIFILSIINFTAITAGVGTCIIGLGHPLSMEGILVIGVALNALSIVSITPGNFGVREVVITSILPLTTIPFGVAIQGASIFIYIRLITCFALASLLRTNQMNRT